MRGSTSTAAMSTCSAVMRPKRLDDFERGEGSPTQSAWT